MMFFGIPFLIVLGLVFKGYRFMKITEDLITIWSVHAVGMIFSIDRKSVV